jgi:prophage maintenance system killer protein
MYHESNIVHKIDVIEMFELKRLKAPIYIVFIAPMVLMRSDDVELYTIEVEEIQLSFKYTNYVDVFLKEEAAKFLKSICVEHAIPIKEDVEVSYKSIYSLSMNEL